MLWQLKRIVSMRRLTQFFWAPKQIFIKRWARNVLQFYAKKKSLSKPMTFVFYLMKVIRYYSPDLYPRTYHPPNPQKWNDNNVAAKDQFERMSGYTYFGILDHDEFLIPSRNRSLKQMMVSCLTHLNRMEFPTLLPFRWLIPYNCGPVFWNQPQSDTWPLKKPSPYIYT